MKREFEDDTFEAGRAAGYLRGMLQPKPEHLDLKTIAAIVGNALICTKSRPDDTNELLARNLATAEEVAAEIFAAEEDMKAAEILYQDARYKAIARKEKARESCGHWATKPIDFPEDYEFYVCLICGAEVEK